MTKLKEEDIRREISSMVTTCIVLASVLPEEKRDAAVQDMCQDLASYVLRQIRVVAAVTVDERAGVEERIKADVHDLLKKENLPYVTHERVLDGVTHVVHVAFLQMLPVRQATPVEQPYDGRPRGPRPLPHVEQFLADQPSYALPAKVYQTLPRGADYLIKDFVRQYSRDTTPGEMDAALQVFAQKMFIARLHEMRKLRDFSRVDRCVADLSDLTNPEYNTPDFIKENLVRLAVGTHGDALFAACGVNREDAKIASETEPQSRPEQKDS